MRGAPFILALMGGALLATAADAHAHLMAATPAQGSAGPAPAVLTLSFSERLEPKFSAVTLSKDGASVVAASSLGPDRKSLLGKPARPLIPGAYAVHWQAVAADGHKTAGDYNFTVK